MNIRTLNNAQAVHTFMANKDLGQMKVNSKTVEIEKHGCVIASLQFADEYDADQFFCNPFLSGQEYASLYNLNL